MKLGKDTKRVMAITAFVLVASVGASSGCSSRGVSVGGDEGPSRLPGSGDADAGEGGAPLPEILMCPVTTCSPPWATCSSSRFPCDIDFSSDDQNCGGCGTRCFPEGAPGANWHCVTGRCTFGCQRGASNCDGDPTNGCEVFTDYDPDNCGDCGNKCAAGLVCALGKCQDPCGADLPDVCKGNCTNLQVDDSNCGSCGTKCDPEGPSLPPLPADMYYGCVGGRCGQRKCAVMDQADCNGNIIDGCEATIHTNDHCTACNDACPASKVCGPISGNLYGCLCLNDRETYCGGPVGCRVLDDDPQNCGGCNHVCPGVYRQNFGATCTFGVCGGRCTDNYADCDGVPDNGCEVDTRIDNRNCGACGNACLPDQVCSGGKCLVTPCDAGVGPTR